MLNYLENSEIGIIFADRKNIKNRIYKTNLINL